MFGAAARIAARPAVAAAAAAATVTASQGPAHARAPPGSGQSAACQAAHPPAHSNKLVDRDTEGWVLAELQDEMVLFQPFDGQEVDEAASTVMAMWSGRAGPSAAGAYPIVTEPGDEAQDDTHGGGGSSSASSTSDGYLADAVIEAAAAASAEAVSAGRRQEREELESLMAITTRMLRRPGMQREVVMCMLEDQEVRQLMLRQCSDLDRYLLAAGIPNPQLLTSGEGAPTAAASFAASAAGAPHDSGSSVPRETDGDGNRNGGPNLIDKLVGAVGGAVAGALEKAGDALAFLGGWLRRHLAPFIIGPSDHEAGWGQEEAEAEGLVADGEATAAGGGGGGGRRRAPKRGADVVLGGVMALAVAVFCVAIIRKPLVLRSLSRR